MTDNNHLIIPPPELVQRWMQEFFGPQAMQGAAPGELVLHIAAVAANWGANQELDACCADIHTVHGKHRADWLREMRRPKPPSRKEQALAKLAAMERLWEANSELVRCLLEALPE